MTDKAVGKLWRKINETCSALDTCLNHGDLVAVIRKLVEERTKAFYLESDDAEIEALREFGIDPATWRREKVKK